MPNRTGTYESKDRLDSRFPDGPGYDVAQMTEAIQIDNDQWNRQIFDQMAMLVNTTTERVALSGTSTRVRGRRLGEHGRGRTQQDEQGTEVAYPLFRFGYPVSWTRTFFKQATPTDILSLMVAIRNAHIRDLRNGIQVALFTPTNRTEFDEYGKDVNLQLIVRALYNADGVPIPDNPNSGTTFDGSTHTHYNGSTGSVFNAPDIKSLVVDNIREHQVASQLMLVVHVNDESLWLALDKADGFTGLSTLGVSEEQRDVQVAILDESQMENRFIGVFHGAQVWIKPWALENYTLGYDMAGSKSLSMRLDPFESSQGLELIQRFEFNPINVDFFEAMFGFGVSERSKAAIIQHDDTSYNLPTFPSL